MSLLRLCDDSLLTVAQHLTFAERHTFVCIHRRTWQLLKRHLPQAINMCHTWPDVVPKALVWVAANCAQLKSLNLHGCDLKLDDILPSLFDTCSAIEVLNLQHCPHASHITVDAIAEKLHETIRQISFWDTNKGDLGAPILRKLVRKCAAIEVLDLRGQSAVDDDMLADMEGLKRLRKVALAGTRVSGLGFAKLIHGRRDSIVRMGCFNLFGPSGAMVPIAAQHLEQLQIGYLRTTMRVDIQKCPNLKCIGVGGLDDLESVIDWKAAATSKLEQIMAEGINAYPESFLSCLQSLSKQLIFLSLTRINHPAFKTIIPSLHHLKQLNIAYGDTHALPALDKDHLLSIATLPNLQYLRIGLNVDKVAELVATPPADGPWFPSLVSFCFATVDDDDDAVVARLVSLMPRLAALYVGYYDGNILPLLQALSHERMKVLNVASTTFPDEAFEEVRKMVHLTRLILDAKVLANSNEVCMLVVRDLPELKVLGPERTRYSHANVFCRWWHMPDASNNSRHLRLHDSYGYDEGSGIKPFDQFVNFIDEDVDPVFPVMEP
ncbi:hypothetical protein DIPPA_20435 [Diplonema papillatum]|nr:hypothetical protein DIPPA_20435 [Diplonema papillatum]